MNKKIVYGVGLVSLTILLLITSIRSLDQLYTDDKKFKMVYMVKPGESLKDIGAKFNVDVKTIKQLNDCNEYVVAGTILKIPVPIRK